MLNGDQSYSERICRMVSAARVTILAVDTSFPIHQGTGIVQTRYELNGTYVVGVCVDSTRKSLPPGIE